MGNVLFEIFDFVSQYYDAGELKELCFNLEVEYDDLPAEGQGRRSHALELVKYLARREQVETLLAKLQIDRPEAYEKAGFQFEQLTQFTQQDKLVFLADATIKVTALHLHDHYYAYYQLAEHEAEIERMLDALYDDKHRSVAMLHGLGGIGKTAVTIELIRRTLQDPDIPFRKITWNSAKQTFYEDRKIRRIKDATIDWNALFNSIGEQLVGIEWSKLTEIEKEKELLQILHETPSLIVVDNLETIKNAEEIVFNLKGMLGASKLLLTSRERVDGNYYKQTLTGLSLESTDKFLRQEIENRNLDLPPLTEAELHRIRQDTSGMPLALKLVIGKAETIGIDAALEDFLSGRDDIYPFIFYKTIMQMPNPAKKILLYLAVNPHTIKLQELTRFAEKHAFRQGELNDALTNLVRSSLVSTENLPSEEIGYNIHQLTRQFVVNDLRKMQKQ